MGHHLLDRQTQQVCGRTGKRRITSSQRHEVEHPAKVLGNARSENSFSRNIWYQHSPLYLRPFLLFFYRYLVRLGFLDGKEGLVFHLFQSLWFRMLVDAKIDELRDAPEPVAETIAAHPD